MPVSWASPSPSLLGSTVSHGAFSGSIWQAPSSSCCSSSSRPVGALLRAAHMVGDSPTPEPLTAPFTSVLGTVMIGWWLLTLSTATVSSLVITDAKEYAYMIPSSLPVFHIFHIHSGLNRVLPKCNNRVFIASLMKTIPQYTLKHKKKC